MNAAFLRHRLWRAVLALTGGLTVRGALPEGGCVVVANHRSHADTAALLAALDARHAPRVAAAADYWFAGGWRTTAGRALAAAFPVRRTGGGSADLAAAAALLRAGHAVVVYPEGSRCGGTFHAGAFRLAAAAGVPVVPVGIAGTGELLPRHGRLHRHPVEVRIGAALSRPGDAAPQPATAGAPAAIARPGPAAAGAPDPAAAAGSRHARSTSTVAPPRSAPAPLSAPPTSGTPPRPAPVPDPLAGVDPAMAQAAVDRLSAPPAARPESRWHHRAARLATSSAGLALVAAWAAAEAIVWPLLPELVLFALLLAAPRAGARLIPAAVLASMAGGLCTFALGATAPAAPLVTEPMRAEVRVEVAARGAAAVHRQPLSGIPFKVYAAEAGRAGVDPVAFLGAAIQARGLRIALVGMGCSLLGALLARDRHLYPFVLVSGTVMFAVGLALVVAAWT